MGKHADIRVSGAPELVRALRKLIDEVRVELAQGMIPQHRYHGRGAVPFTVTRITRAARAASFADLQLRGFDDGE